MAKLRSHQSIEQVIPSPHPAEESSSTIDPNEMLVNLADQIEAEQLESVS